MTAQNRPEAIRLADGLEDLVTILNNHCIHPGGVLEAAAELRRLHAISAVCAPATEQAAPVAWRIKTRRRAGGWLDGAPTAEQLEEFRMHASSITLEYAYAAPGGEAPVPAAPTDKMVDAYLKEQRRVVEDADCFGRPNMGALHTNTVREACRAGLAAAIATQTREGSAQ